MAWIKRNLFFVLGSLVALGLMVVGVVVLLSQIADEQRVADDIQKQYATLTQLNTQNPHPGVPPIDNIKAAKDQEAELRAYIGKVRKVFRRVAPIPDFTTNRISNSEFAAQLRNTIAQLHRSADQHSVILSAPDYYFTFEAQKKTLNFDPGSLDSLAVHVGEIKALSEVLFDAKINSLDSIRREMVSASDNGLNPQDYLSQQKTISTPLADLTPYEVTFRCFSSELAQVLAGLATSQYGFIVKTINIEHPNSAGLAMNEDPNMSAEMLAAQQQAMRDQMIMRERMAARGGDRAPGRFAPPLGMPGGPGMPAPTVAPRGPQLFLNEKPVRVTLLVQVVKIKPGAK